MSWGRLRSAFKTGIGADVLEIENPSPNRIRVQFRLPTTKMKELLEFVKQAYIQNAWSTDISKFYFLSRDGMVRYCWRAIFFVEQGDIAECEGDIADTLNRSGGASPAAMLSTYPLPPSATAARNAPVNGKGANATSVKEAPNSVLPR